MPQSREHYLSVGSSLEELIVSLNQILSRISDRLDRAEGFRDSPVIYSDVDLQTNQISALSKIIGDDNNLTIENNLTLPGTLDVAGQVTFTDGLDVSGGMTVSGATTFSSKVNINAPLSVGTGNQADFNGPVIHSSTVTNSGAVTNNSTVTNNDATFLSGDVTMGDGDNIILDVTTGTKIGTATNQKLAFFNTTPVVQQATISDPSGGGVQDAEARSAINDIIDALQAFGFIA